MSGGDEGTGEDWHVGVAKAECGECVETPDGRRYRWSELTPAGEEEPEPEGGHETRPSTPRPERPRWARVSHRCCSALTRSERVPKIDVEQRAVMKGGGSYDIDARA